MNRLGRDPAAQTAGQILAREMLSTLAEETATFPGVTRIAYGQGEQLAHDLVRSLATGIGADIDAQVDAAGNLILTLAGLDRSLPAIVIGSHLDSVPHGGNFDGAAGVAAGLAVLADLVSFGFQAKRDIAVLAIRAEEAAWFPLSYPGSRAALGRLAPEELQARRRDSGLTLFEHMRLAGFDPVDVERGTPQIAGDRIAAFLEVHIEQGPRLVAAEAPIALVTGIAGGRRYVAARCLGEYAHSGAEPRRSRRDSVLGVADLIQALEEEWDAIERDGFEATITFGRIESDPAQHGGSRVLGEVGFTLDLRSENLSVLDRLQRRVAEITAEIEARRSVRFELGPLSAWEPATMSAPLLDALDHAGRGLSMDLPRMPSGAGHDAAAFAAEGIPTAMIFVRNRNGSHNPHEHMDINDLDVAIDLLTEFVRRYDNPCISGDPS